MQLHAAGGKRAWSAALALPRAHPEPWKPYGSNGSGTAWERGVGSDAVPEGTASRGNAPSAPSGEQRRNRRWLWGARGALTVRVPAPRTSRASGGGLIKVATSFPARNKPRGAARGAPLCRRLPKN